MNLDAIQASVKDELNAVDQIIIEQAKLTDVELISNIGHHIVTGRSKRLRPLMLLLTAKLLGNIQQNHLVMAAVIEFIHTATLLHDDVVDESKLRRGQPTANQVWGNQASVLVGDFVYSRAFELMVSVGNMQVMDLMSETTNVIASGEVLQLVANQNSEVTESEYFKIIERKTAKLFSASTIIGGILNGANEQQQTALGVFGQEIGNAFQIVDDLLDYVGEIDSIGKNIGDDLQNGKTTLPLIYFYQQASTDERELIASCLSAPTSSSISTLLSLIQHSSALKQTEAKAKSCLDIAVSALNDLPNNETSEQLMQLCEFVVGRKH